MFRRNAAPRPLTPGQKIVRSKEFGKAARSVLNRHDLAGLIAKGAPADEYEFQQAAILRKLPACRSVERLAAMMHEEFSHWFSRENAGPREKYKESAGDLFRLYREYLDRPLLPTKPGGNHG